MQYKFSYDRIAQWRSEIVGDQGGGGGGLLQNKGKLIRKGKIKGERKDKRLKSGRRQKNNLGYTTISFWW